MAKGRKPFPRWDMKPTDGSHSGILVGAEDGEKALEKAREIMGWTGPLTATERYNY